jgi:hypothetical protein
MKHQPLRLGVSEVAGIALGGTISAAARTEKVTGQ